MAIDITLSTTEGVCETSGEGGNRRREPKYLRDEGTGWWRHKPVRRVVHAPNRRVRVSLDRLDELDPYR